MSSAGQLSATGVALGATADEIVALARASIGHTWAVDGCAAFVWGVTNLAGLPFFDTRDMTFGDDPLQPLDAAYIVPHSPGLYSGISNVGGDGWMAVSSPTSVASLLAILQPGDVVRVYAAGNTGEDTEFGGQYGAHSFIVSAVTATDVYVIDNWSGGQISEHAWQNIVTAFASSGSFGSVFVSRIDSDFVEATVPGTLQGLGEGNWSTISLEQPDQLVGLSDSDAILAGAFLALAVYGGSAIPEPYRGVLTGEDDDLNYDDRYGSYLNSLGTPWSVLTESDLNASWFYDADGERVGSINAQGLYRSAPQTFLEYNLNEAIAATTTIDGRNTLILAFRGSDGRDAGYESQTFTSFGTINYYLGLRPFIGAVAEYARQGANGIESVIIAGHSLGGTMADLFFIVDADKFGDLDINVISIASAGIDPAVEVGGSLLSGSALLLDAQARSSSDYIGIAHTNDRVSHSVEITDSIFSDLARNGVLQDNNHYFGFDINIDLPKIQNVDVVYPGWFYDALHGFGAQHNGELYWANIQALMRDPLYTLRGDRGVVMGLADYSAVPDYAEVTWPLFRDWIGADDFGVDNDSGAGGLGGTDGAEYILGLTGNDAIFGHGGDDLVSGGGGNDTAYAGPGNDTAHGGEGDDDFRGEENADSLFGGHGADTIFGGSENDTLLGGNDGDDLRGQDHADSLVGGKGGDTLDGGPGDDTLDGGGDGDILSDSLHGGDGNDILIARFGLDSIAGGSGADRFVLDGTWQSYILDYNQGDSGDYLASEQDVIDISPLVGAAYAAGQAEGALRRLTWSSSRDVLILEVDIDGTETQNDWRTVAELPGVPTGDAGIRIVLGASVALCRHRHPYRAPPAAIPSRLRPAPSRRTTGPSPSPSPGRTPRSPRRCTSAPPSTAVRPTTTTTRVGSTSPGPSRPASPNSPWTSRSTTTAASSSRRPSA